MNINKNYVQYKNTTLYGYNKISNEDKILHDHILNNSNKYIIVNENLILSELALKLIHKNIEMINVNYKDKYNTYYDYFLNNCCLCGTNTDNYSETINNVSYLFGFLTKLQEQEQEQEQKRKQNQTQRHIFVIMKFEHIVVFDSFRKNNFLNVNESYYNLGYIRDS